MRVFRRSLRVLLRSRPPLIAGHGNRCWNRLECRDRNPGSPSLSARDARASVRATIPHQRPRAVHAIANHDADPLKTALSAQSAPDVPGDRVCRNRCSVGREKFAHDLLARFYARDKRRCAKTGVGTNKQRSSGACHDRKRIKGIAMLQKALF